MHEFVHVNMSVCVNRYMYILTHPTATGILQIAKITFAIDVFFKMAISIET